ncbi:probable Feruloyl esterase B [Cephalotrichum gorgonifer]|uniref:Carboxylic ester hydrolase n=1 Tax=Cephalotrichum gorgonifer TaxID=2041049 RepID=A0AAE8MWY2_9PEZI|nr:probable Feruloyl esterase B [Cephalotrichum gorgonifer]
MRTSIFGFLATAACALGASLQQVANFGENPTRINMYIYVPDNVAPNPAIIVALHPCGGSAPGWFAGTRLPSYADREGFILIYAGTPNQSNCWDVHSPASLTHGQGGDALAIVNMVKYTLENHNGDPEKVYVMGSSSGAMMTNVLAGSYPDVFEAGAAFSGTAHACFAGAAGATPFAPNQTCAQGLQHTPQEWANYVYNSYPGYEGRRTRMMIWHGNADGLVRPQCAHEALKQWSEVLGVSLTASNTGVPSAAYTQEVYGDGSQLQGFFGAGVGHTAPVNEDYILRFFGIIQ